MKKDKKEKKAKRKRLKSSMLTACIIFAVCLSSAIGLLGFFTYTASTYYQYEENIKEELIYATIDLDVDQLKVAIQDRKWNDTCQNLKKRLDDMIVSHDIAYIYIIRPLNVEEKDNMINILSGETDEEKSSNDSIQFMSSTGDEYPPSVVEHFIDRMDGSSHITYFSNNTKFGYMYTGIKPLIDSEGMPVCLLCIDIGMDEIFANQFVFIFLVLIGTVIITVLFLVFLIKWLNHRIVSPISKIETTALTFVQSSHEEKNPENIIFTNPKITTGDEMEKLSDSVTAMAEDLIRYMVDLVKETSEKEKNRTELNLATTIQASSLPNVFPPFPERNEFDIYASMDPAKEVGGDFYDFFMIDEDHLGIVIADVSGKGIPAALFMMISKILLKNQACNGFSPKRVLEEVNNQLCSNNKAEMFVTVWLGILEISTGKILAGNAGHEYPITSKSGGAFEILKDRHGFVLGGMSGIPYREYEFYLKPGEVLFLYTDGVTEATNEKNELFGNDRLLEALNRSPEADPQTLLVNVRKEVDHFVGEAPQFDDLTMLVLKYFGSDKK